MTFGFTNPIFGSSRNRGCLMDNHGRGILGKRDATGEEIRQAMGYAIREAVRDHKRAGNPIAVRDWGKNGIVIVPPEEINVPDEEVVRDEADETRIGQEG
ncbi:MAG TPA: hypothetical protein VKP69_32410 [Isosphaeraceae bacterium]|nr:hypothetical protein [Isosphaeraceae bacterium]